MIRDSWEIQMEPDKFSNSFHMSPNGHLHYSQEATASSNSYLIVELKESATVVHGVSDLAAGKA